MHTRDEILEALDRMQSESAAYWSAFSAEEFFAKIGTAWSPAENVRHLAKSIRPVTKALRLPRFVLLLMFGAPRRDSISYEALRERYRGKLAAGGEAGRFAPSSQAVLDREAVLALQTSANGELRAAIARWPEAALDRRQLPHPLLGKLTVREMLFFTLYHQQHHIDVVKRRLAEAAATPAG
ncbi:MAG: DinB family protein [Acidobacteriota bacterium]